jgi:hypothetical protein
VDWFITAPDCSTRFELWIQLGLNRPQKNP